MLSNQQLEELPTSAGTSLTAFPAPPSPTITKDSPTTTKVPESQRPSGAADAVLKPSDPVPENWKQVRGIEFNDFEGRDVTVTDLLEGMERIGFQGSNVSRAAKIIDEMVCTLFNQLKPY